MSTSIYLYKQTVLLRINSINQVYEMYNDGIKLYKGVNNTIQFQIKNDNQKSVDITNKTVKFFVSGDNGILLIANGEITNALSGLVNIVITEEQLANIFPQLAKFSVKVTDDSGNTEIAYVDGNNGINGFVEIMNGAEPAVRESKQFNKFTEIIIPAQPGIPTQPSPYETTSYKMTATLNQNNALQTASFYLDNFSGTIQIKGSLLNNAHPQPEDFFIVKNIIINEPQSSVIYENWNGVYTQVKFCYIPSTGVVSKILYRP